MPHSVELREPELSPAARRVLAAVLFSLGLHAAIIGLVRLAPAPMASSLPGVLQVRLQEPHQLAAPAPLKPVVGDVAVMTAVASSALPLNMLPSKPDMPAPVAPITPAAREPDPLPRLNASPPIPSSQANLPTVSVPLLVDNTYYTAKEVDVHPRALQTIQPAYPEAAAAQNIQGWVLLKLKLDESGKVEEVKVADASPPGVFDQTTLDAFAKAHFAPAQKAGRAVKALVEIKVWFNLN